MKSAKPIMFMLISAVIASLVYFPISAHAVPLLQLYAEGATYDPASESWVQNISSGGSSTIRIWAIGNVESKGTIYDVRMAIAYDHSNTTAGIGLTSYTTGGYGGFTDPSTPSAPIFLGVHTDGSVPTLSDGGALPSHDEYGPGVDWQEFDLGNFSLLDSPIADFIDAFPSPGLTNQGQINVYEVSLYNFAHGTTVHFDLYDHYQARNKAMAVFAPFSHDATAVPEPGTMLLLGSGLIGLAGYGRKRFRK